MSNYITENSLFKELLPALQATLSFMFSILKIFFQQSKFQLNLVYRLTKCASMEPLCQLRSSINQVATIGSFQGLNTYPSHAINSKQIQRCAAYRFPFCACESAPESMVLSLFECFLFPDLTYIR